MLSLGAINKFTNEYMYPKIANKKDTYICPDCNKDLILCRGEIRTPYFRHKVDTITPCNYYNSPSESQIHKDAKLLIKRLLEKKVTLLITRKCAECGYDDEFEIPQIREGFAVHIEHRFEYNGLKIADVAYLNSSDILCIFEICNTHKTNSENRPEPWFEINAETLIKTANKNETSSLLLSCIRCEKCEECNNNEKYKNNDADYIDFVKKKITQRELFLKKLNAENIKYDLFSDRVCYIKPHPLTRDKFGLWLRTNKISYHWDDGEYDYGHRTNDYQYEFDKNVIYDVIYFIIQWFKTGNEKYILDNKKIKLK